MANTYLNIKYNGIDQNVPTKETMELLGWNTMVIDPDTNEYMLTKQIMTKQAGSDNPVMGCMIGMGSNLYPCNMMFVAMDRSDANFSGECNMTMNVNNDYAQFDVTVQHNYLGNNGSYYILAGLSLTANSEKGSLQLNCTETLGCPTPSENTSIANKQYVDTKFSSTSQATFTVVDL